MLIVNGPYVPVKVTIDRKIVPMEPKEFNSDNFRRMEKNAKAKKLLYLGLRLTSTLASQSVNPQRRYVMLFK